MEVRGRVAMGDFSQVRMPVRSHAAHSLDSRLRRLARLVNLFRATRATHRPPHRLACILAFNQDPKVSAIGGPKP
jgi:hypothetical protein